MVLAATFVLSLALVNPILAQEESSTGEHPWPGRCDRLQERIAGRLDNFKAHRDDHIAKYQRVVEKSERAIEKLREKGYDESLVNQFETDLKTLKDMINDFGSDVDVAMIALESANDYNCGESEGEFGRRLETARDLFGIVREDVFAIRDFVKGTIKADIQALKDSK